MLTRFFLILVEGPNDVKDIVKILKLYFSVFTEEMPLEIETDVSRNIVDIKFNDTKHTVYIKSASSQNLINFNKKIKEKTSIEKMYGITQPLVATFSIFDLDHGSSSDEQCIDYFGLRTKQENFYPILCYPAYESYYLQNVHKNLLSDSTDLLNDKKLHNIAELIINLNILPNQIELKTDKDISTKIKDFSKQLKRSKFYNKIDVDELVNNNFNYLVQNFQEEDYYYYLNNQDKIYKKTFSPRNRIIMASFVICVFKMIFDWVNGEDEE